MSDDKSLTFWFAVSGFVGALLTAVRSHRHDPLSMIVAICAGTAAAVYLGGAVQEHFNLTSTAGRAVGFLFGVMGMGVVQELMTRPLVQLIALWKKG